MFEIGMSELVMIFVIALVVLGPQRLPKLVSQVGRWAGKAKAMARQFREQLESEINLEELTKANKAAAAKASAEPTPSPDPEPAPASTDAQPDPSAPAPPGPVVAATPHELPMTPEHAAFENPHYENPHIEPDPVVDPASHADLGASDVTQPAPTAEARKV